MTLKYISFYCTLTLMSYASLYPSQEQPCYLALMPPDILKRIALLLPFHDRETEDEFIARTRPDADIPEEATYKSLLTPLPLPKGANMCGVAKAYCPNKTKVIFCENLYGNSVSPTITIIDRRKNTVLCKKEINTGTYEIALSGNACNFALIPSPGVPGSPVLSVYSTNDTNNKPIHSFALSECLCHINFPIAFNKQSTQIIVHHSPNPYANASYISNPCVITKPYTLFSIASEENVAYALQKTLSGYFYSKRVCNDLNASL